MVEYLTSIRTEESPSSPLTLDTVGSSSLVKFCTTAGVFFAPETRALNRFTAVSLMFWNFAFLRWCMLNIARSRSRAVLSKYSVFIVGVTHFYLSFYWTFKQCQRVGQFYRQIFFSSKYNYFQSNKIQLVYIWTQFLSQNVSFERKFFRVNIFPVQPYSP